MERVIYKFPLEIKDEQTITVPEGSVVLSVGNQSGKLCIWLECTKESLAKKAETEMTVLIRSTGRAFSPKYGDVFLGMVMQHGGGLVWHVYIRLKTQYLHIREEDGT